MSVVSVQGEASVSGDEHSVHSFNSIGELFREWGEVYIDTFCPDLRTIKLIRAVRVCRTPTLGGQRYDCKDCGAAHYHYFSCGHSHCPICQGVKRLRWQDRLRSRMLPVPYAHITFTVPHELNGLMRGHPALMYNLLFQSAWSTIKELFADPENVGGLPGMTAVLHTWGSDLKYHVHLHCLVTFGGYDATSGEWRWPRRKGKVAPYRLLRGLYRAIFLERLRAEMLAKNSRINYHEDYDTLTRGLTQKAWVVNHQPPTADTILRQVRICENLAKLFLWPARRENAGIAKLRQVFPTQRAAKRASEKSQILGWRSMKSLKNTWAATSVASASRTNA